MFRKPDLKPFNYGTGDYPRLPVGSKLYAVLENDAMDFIAGYCGMNMNTVSGFTLGGVSRHSLSI
jgi:hypothetical protein